jgi:hypothetical protein
MPQVRKISQWCCYDFNIAVTYGTFGPVNLTQGPKRIKNTLVKWQSNGL